MPRKGNLSPTGLEAALQAEIEELRAKNQRLVAKGKEDAQEKQKLAQDNIALKSKIEECETARKTQNAERGQLESKIKQEYEEKLQQDRTTLKAKTVKKETQLQSRLGAFRLDLAEADSELTIVRSEVKSMRTTMAEQTAQLDYQNDEYIATQLLADCLALIVDALDNERLSTFDPDTDFEASFLTKARAVSAIDRPKTCLTRTNLDKLERLGLYAESLRSGCACWHSENATRLFTCVVQCADIIRKNDGLSKKKAALTNKGPKFAGSSLGDCCIREACHYRKL